MVLWVSLGRNISLSDLILFGNKIECGIRGRMHILAVLIIAISAKITFSAPVAEYADRPISDAISSRDELVATI